jgi:tagaturonate reductase
MGPVSKLCLILVISANCAAVAPQFNPQNIRIWIIAGICICFSVLGFSLGKLTAFLGRRLGFFGKGDKEKEISIFLASGLRNTSAAMTLSIDFFSPAAAVPAVLGIMFQQTICALMGRLFMGKVSRERAGES